MAEPRPVEQAGTEWREVVDAWRILLAAARQAEEATKQKEDEGVTK